MFCHGVLVSLLVGHGQVVSQPFIVQGPVVNTNDFRITTFAGGLNFPLGMARLADDSLLVTISGGPDFFHSTGQLVRFTDSSGNGIADGVGTILYSNLPGTLTSVRVMDRLVFVVGRPYPIHILRAGATPSAPLTLVGKLILTYPASWSQHQHSELGLRRTPGFTNRYDLSFQIGAENNFAASTDTVILTNENVQGASAVLAGDSIHQITIIDTGDALSATNITRIASGVRNPAGFAFQPTTGDFFFADNGIDSGVSPDEISADELNYISRTNFGAMTSFFGFPTNYTSYRSNLFVGGAGIAPLIAFQPVPDPFTGSQSTGPNQITFAPPGFPPGLNTGIFVAFHGTYTVGGTNNTKNPLIYADPATGSYFQFIYGQQPGIGHLDGLLATRDSLFVADLVTGGDVYNGAGQGAIYQIKSLISSPPMLATRLVGAQIELTWDRGALLQASDVHGPWTIVPNAFSPQLIAPGGPAAFYRVGY
jgi:hypothetical protein